MIHFGLPLSWMFAACAYGLLAFMLLAQMLRMWPGEVAEQWHEVICVCRTGFALASVPLIVVGIAGWIW